DTERFIPAFGCRNHDSQSEVRDEDFLSAAYQYVARLEITMNYATLMGMLDCLRHRMGNSHSGLDREWPSIETLLKVFTVDPVQHKKVAAARKLPQSVNANNPRVTELGQQLSLLDK